MYVDTMSGRSSIKAEFLKKILTNYELSGKQRSALPEKCNFSGKAPLLL